jgi:RNA polymerase sigma-70 factor (ECF subfamily)
LEQLSDKEVIVRILNGNHDLYRLIVERYKKPVAAVIKGMLGDCAEAEDVGQETFIRLYNSLGDFRGDATLKTYLLKIAMNLSLNEINKRKRYSSTTISIDQVVNYSPEPEMHISERADIMEMINHSLEKLDPKQRSVFILRVVEGYSTKEAAKILKIPLGTVLSRLQRAVEEMRRLVTR